ncbi:hypothetical protein [uncultured Nocardioides sp.]|uniref:hypothetical protein n=1 Tax=uncultured Nocardioides sp. TaxID=198441 RepID=UPI00261205A8|nr:hypothetical protein [uncultured Nocardioides sp.]
MRTDTALQAADAVFMAEQAVGRARRVVDALHNTISSALRVLDDAELDSAKARLSDRGDYYLEAAGEHMSRLQRRCSDNAELADELTGHLEHASQVIADAHDLLQDADTSDPEIATEVAQLKPRLTVVGEMIDLAKPMARLTAQHVDSAQLATQHVTPASLLEPVTLERSIATAGKELGRADEDVRLLENIVDHAAANARQSAGIASDITDNARRRMAEQRRGQVPRQAAPAGGSPAR